MQKDKRKEWLREAILLSIFIHIVLVGLSFFIKMDRPQQLFYVTMASPAIEVPLVERQRVPPRPVASAPAEPDSSTEPSEAVSEESIVEEPLEQVIAEQVLPPLPEIVIPAAPVTPSPTRAPATQPVVNEPPRVVAPPVRPTPPASTPLVPVSPPPAPAVVTPTPLPPPVVVTPDPTEVIPPVISSTQDSEPTTPESGQEAGSVSEEWRFLEADNDDTQRQNNRLRGEALYSFQLSSRYVVEEPDFSFVENSNLSTNIGSIRVRLSILADGSVVQAVILGGGTGSQELDNAFINSLLAVTFNDVSSVRRGTQVGILTIRFE